MAPIARNKNYKLQELLHSGFDYPPPSVAASPATGLITCVTDANMLDTDFLTIGDGIAAPVLYEYDKAANGVTGGRTAWPKGAATASDCATTLATIINTTQKTLNAVANGVDGAGTVRITHRWPGTGGNVTITESVVNAGFLVSGMAGGTGASTTADTTVKMLPLIAAAEIIDAQLVCPAGMTAASDTDYVVVKLVRGDGTVAASWSTKLTGGNGALTSSFQAMTLATLQDDRRAALGDYYALFVDVTGAPTVPPLRVSTHIRYRSAPKA